MTQKPPAYLRKLEAEMRPAVAAAFREAVRDITSSIVLSRVVAAIESNDVEALFLALNIGEEFYGPLTEAVRNVYMSGGAGAVGALPAIANPNGVGPLVLRFGGRTLRAEEWIKTRSSTLITEITDGQRDAVRETLRAGREAGRGARDVALDISGRVENGRRVGGTVGLNGPQARAVENARLDLESLDERYFTRTRRDRRFDKTVRAAIDNGKPLTRAQVDKITGRYSDRLLQLRAENIARTETIGALNAGRLEGMREMIDKGAVDAQDVSKVWNWSGKNNPRHWHREMTGQTVGMDGYFLTPKNNLVAYPCDPAAPAVETVNCGCYMAVEVDYIGAYARKRKTARV